MVWQRDVSQVQSLIMKFAKNHIIKMIIVLFVWAMFYQVYALDGNINVFTIRVAIKNVLLGETQTHLWFLYVTIGFYLLVPIIKVYTNSASKNSMVYTLLIIGMITIGIDTLSMLTGTIPVIVSNNISKMTLSSGKYVFYFLVGHYIDKYNLPKRPLSYFEYSRGYCFRIRNIYYGYSIEG